MTVAVAADPVEPKRLHPSQSYEIAKPGRAVDGSKPIASSNKEIVEGRQGRLVVLHLRDRILRLLHRAVAPISSLRNDKHEW